MKPITIRCCCLWTGFVTEQTTYHTLPAWTMDLIKDQHQYALLSPLVMDGQDSIKASRLFRIGTYAYHLLATRTSVAVFRVDGFGQIDPGDVRDGGQPCEDVCEFFGDFLFG